MSKITKKIDGLITENEVKRDLSNDRKEQERLFWEGRAYRKVRSLIEKDAALLERLEFIVFDELYEASKPSESSETRESLAKQVKKELLQAIVIEAGLDGRFNTYKEECDNAEKEK